MDHYRYGAVCNDCHLAVGQPLGSETQALNMLESLHRERDELPRGTQGTWACRRTWELVTVKVTPPVGEWRTTPFSA
jgi:hypothetical protein